MLQAGVSSILKIYESIIERRGKMIRKGVFEQVVNLSKRSKNKKLTKVGLLLGFVKLISMDDGVLNVMFTPEEIDELKKIADYFDKEQIDLELVKQGGSLLASNSSEVDERETEELVKEMIEDSRVFNAIDVLKVICNGNSPEIRLMKRGYSVDDIINYATSGDLSILKTESQRAEAIAKSSSQAQAENNASDNNTSDNKETGEKTSDSEERTEKETEADSSGGMVDKFAAELRKSKEEIGEKKKAYEDDYEGFGGLVDKTNKLYESLKCKIKGQDEAIKMFAEGYFQSEVLKKEETDRKSPMASFLFAGPPGVGKTYLANMAAEILKLPYLKLDMGQYSHAGLLDVFIKEICGFVSGNPRSFIVVDEIEKAHETIVMPFLQILDGGSAFGCSFTDTIMVFTTNAGKSLYEEGQFEKLSNLPRSVVAKALDEETNVYGKVFPAGLISRFASGNLIMFNQLDVNDLIGIINDNIGESVQKIKKIYDYDVEVDERIAPMILFANSTDVDARKMSSHSRMLIKNEMYEFGRHLTDADATLQELKTLKMRVEFDEANEEISRLFKNDNVSNILFVGDADKMAEMPVSVKCNIIYETNVDVISDIIDEKDISFAVVDLMCGKVKGETDYLSLDDIKTEGVLAFDYISDKFPQLPIYAVERPDIGKEDKKLFMERGVREFVSLDNMMEFSDKLVNIGNIIYMQKMVKELSGRGRVLVYNTAQRFFEDKSKAEILFYDFKTRVAADAFESNMLLSDADKPKDKFDDVIGAENAKDELRAFIDYMKNPKKYMKGSVKIPKGILLYGPPGTGKTMLARAMAGECDLSFFSTTATSFMNKWVGGSEENVRNLFKTARKFAPSIVFIDEIDAIGKERTGDTSSHHSETVLNELLTQMDGFTVNIAKPVFVIAATNFDLDGTTSGKKSRIDPALLRRFDNRILVDLPKENEREKFLKIEFSKLSEHNVTDEAIHNLAIKTTGESLAILKNVIELAIRNARKAGKVVDNDIFLNAYEEYKYGEKREWDQEYFISTAIHESGHAYICSLSGEKPSYVTIVSRGNFGGYMRHENKEKDPSDSREEMRWNIRTALAGRAAEIEFYGEEAGINTGASSDLQNATNVALHMICSYGMDGSLLSLDPSTVLGSSLGEKTLVRVEALLKEQMEITRQLVHEGRDKIKALADFLVKNNQATEQEIADILKIGQ